MRVKFDAKLSLSILLDIQLESNDDAMQMHELLL